MEFSFSQCPIHLELQQVFFCNECEELLCRRCMMDNHRLHDYDETEAVLKTRYALVEKLMKPASQVLLNSKVKKDYSDRRNKLAAYQEEVKLSLKSHFERVHKYLSDREMHLLACLQNMMEREYVSIEDSESNLAQLSSELQIAVTSARKLLQESKSISVLGELKRLSVDLEKIVDAISKLCSSMEAKGKGFELVFSDEDDAILKHAIDKFGVLLDSTNAPFSSPGHSTKHSLSRIVSLPAMSLADEHFSNFDTQASVFQPTAIISCTEKGKNFYPCGISVGSNNLITVSDLHNNFVKVLTNTGKIIDSIEVNKGSQPFRGPCALHVDKNNDIYILERESKSIRKYTNGSLLDLGKFHKQFNDPRGVLVVKDKIYVTDWKNNCIHSISLVNNKLTYQSSFGEGFLKQPAGIAFSDCDHKIVVSDQENHCVWVLSEEGEVVNVVGGEKGALLGMLNSPYGVAVTGDGKVVIAEKGNARISLFSLQGSHLCSFGCKGSNPGQFNHLRHVCTNLSNQILVADEMNQRIQVFDITL